MHTQTHCDKIALFKRIVYSMLFIPRNDLIGNANSSKHSMENGIFSDENYVDVSNDTDWNSVAQINFHSKL